MIEELKNKKKTLWAVEQAEGATLLNELVISDTENLVFIFGNEVKGVAQEVVDQCHGVVEIPQFGTKHSLNISVSVGVVIWDVWSKLT